MITQITDQLWTWSWIFSFNTGHAWRTWSDHRLLALWVARRQVKKRDGLAVQSGTPRWIIAGCATSLALAPPWSSSSTCGSGLCSAMSSCARWSRTISSGGGLRTDSTLCGRCIGPTLRAGRGWRGPRSCGARLCLPRRRSSFGLPCMVAFGLRTGGIAMDCSRTCCASCTTSWTKLRITSYAPASSPGRFGRCCFCPSASLLQ